jgi:DNA-binding transcriptional MerR regulator
MAEVQTGYLSIGEVLGLLLEEFPDITISKIRFLESQGLIAPERTPSGYRKFYEHDVELLKVILREQRENYLPLRVIKDRIDSGAIDPSGELGKPSHDGNAVAGVADVPDVPDGAGVTGVTGVVDVPETSVAAHPAARPLGTPPPAARVQQPADERRRRPTESPPATSSRPPATPQLLPGVLLAREELCAMTGVSPDELAELEQYGIVSGRGGGATATLYGDDAVEIAKVAGEFLRLGVDARHLRGWRTAAEREASLFEQLITPRLRQRNPGARAEAVEQLRHLDALGGRLRMAMMRHALRQYLD